MVEELFAGASAAITKEAFNKNNETSKEYIFIQQNSVEFHRIF